MLGQELGGLKEVDALLSPMEKALSDILHKIFGSCTVVEFNIGNDLQKLDLSFPRLPCFHHFESVIDMKHIVRFTFSDRRKDYVNSLKNVALLPAKWLDKSE
mmetsp:Transcript_64308/g.76130  ORF Transcript_64308/g.76130 Transcript_64308/m.76130 type:complete len:102 (+) Transcript_64308:360-665(+)